MEVRLISKSEFDKILPVVGELYPSTPQAVLQSRLDEMKSQNYQCVGVFDAEKLIAVSGLWILTRLYCGKYAEPDNVVVLPEYRSQGVGKLLINWIENYAREQGCEVMELNAYTTNERAHQFWKSEGFQIIGYHFTRLLK
jgi:GNAT superfamily N-acetyltransferase